MNRLWFQKIAIFLIFGLFTAKAEALILPVPQITAQPLSTNVQKGDTATFNVSASCGTSLIGSVSWYFNNGSSTKLVQTTGSLLSSTVTSTLIVNNVSTNNAGSYYAVIENLLGGSVTSSTAQLSLIPTITGNSGGSGMTAKGFKILFSAPVGSNVVIEATSDMNNWSAVCTNLAVDGSVTYTDAVAKTCSCRFYRAHTK